MRDPGQADRADALAPGLAELRPPVVPGEDLELAVREDPRRHRVGEVRLLEEPAHLGRVVAEQEVVVGEVADDPALGLLQHLVPVRLAVPRSLREVEEADARVVLVAGDDLPGLVLDAVADDEELHGRRPPGRARSRARAGASGA